MLFVKPSLDQELVGAGNVLICSRHQKKPHKYVTFITVENTMYYENINVSGSLMAKNKDGQPQLQNETFL